MDDMTINILNLATVRGFNLALVIVYPFDINNNNRRNINVLAASNAFPISFNVWLANPC